MYLYVAFYLINLSYCILKIHGSESLTSFFCKCCFCRFMLTHSPREAPYGAPQFELHFPKSAIWRTKVMDITYGKTT